MYKVKIGEEELSFEEKPYLLDLSLKYGKTLNYDIVLAVVNNKLRELNGFIEDEYSDVSFITVADDAGYRAYKRSMTMLMIKAFYQIVPNIDVLRVNFSMGAGYFCSVKAEGIALNEELLNKVQEKMMELVKKDVRFEKEEISNDKAYNIFKNMGMDDKAGLFRYRKNSKTNIYKLEDFYDYYFGYMVPSTGYLKHFKLLLHDDGFILQMITKEAPNKLADVNVAKNVYNTLRKSRSWANSLGVSSISRLNDIILDGGFQELVLVAEALQEANIAEIAEDIVKNKDKRFIMIAGPSSSGKTTFSKRLSVQLKAHGLHPYPISVDNYYVNRKDTPLDEQGNYDFENIHAIDLELFNNNMLDLLNGNEIELPVFNFVEGKREYHDDKIKLNNNDVLVIEGIHALNDEMSYALPSNCKYKIYISALMSINIDEHNRIPTTDVRLIRRMVRDARTRGKSANETLEMWNSVRAGEEKYIFPYQEKVDVTFNSSLIYELVVMKQYAEQLLLSIDKKSVNYMEARRLLKFLDYIISMPDNMTPMNSIVREFVGGGCFKI